MANLPGESRPSSNELAEAANFARITLRDVAIDSGDLFPTLPNNFNLLDKSVFIRTQPVIEKSDEGSSRAHMVMISPDGSIKSGHVPLRVLEPENPWDRGISIWDLDDADLEEASDVEVLEYGAALAAEVFRRIAEQSSYARDEQSIQKIIDFSDKKPGIINSLKAKSEPLLKKYFGEDYTPFARTLEDIRNFGSDNLSMGAIMILYEDVYSEGPTSHEEIAAAEARIDKLFSADTMRTILDLHLRREDILETLALSSESSAQEGLNSLKELVELIKDAGIFPPPDDMTGSKTYVYGGEVSALPGFGWAIFANGELGIKKGLDEAPMAVNTNIVRQDIKQIGDNLIRKIIRDNFMGLYQAKY